MLFLVLSSQDKSSYYTDRNAWETYADMPRHCVQSHLVYVGITCMELVYVCPCSNLYPKICILSTSQRTQELVCLVATARVSKLWYNVPRRYSVKFCMRNNVVFVGCLDSNLFNKNSTSSSSSFLHTSFYLYVVLARVDRLPRLPLRHSKTCNCARYTNR